MTLRDHVNPYLLGEQSPRRDIQGVPVPMGKLGYPIGTYLKIEGVRAETGKVGVNTLAVDRVNDKTVDPAVRIWIDNVDALPKGERCVFAGYESGKWIGTPPNVIKHLGDVTVAQTGGWHFYRFFLVIQADAPNKFGKKVPPLSSFTDPAGDTWPPRHTDKLEPFCVEKTAVPSQVAKEWRGQEDWLLAIRRLTFDYHEEKNLRTFWLRNWRAGKELKTAEEEERTVYVEWRHDGLRFFGRRDFRTGKTVFLILPEKGGSFDFTGSMESAQKLINSFLGKRAQLSLKALKQPRTLPVNEGDGRTVRKVFKTPVIFQGKLGDVLHLIYLPETAAAPGLSPSVWVSREGVQIVIHDPVIASRAGQGLIPLVPPPDSVMNPKGVLLDDAISPPPVSPQAFLEKHPKFRECDSRPEMIWEFLSNGAFKAYSMTSTYGFTIEGTWKVLKTGQVALSGTTYNTRTRKRKQFSDRFKRITMKTSSLDSEPAVKIQHETELSAF